MRNRDVFDPAFKALRPAAIERDQNRCVKCGHGSSLEVHHVNGYKDFRLEMLRTLCYYCHGIAPMGAEYWAWEKSGKNGWDACLDHIEKKLKIDRAAMKEALEEVEAYSKFMRVTVASKARASIRKATGRCEGQKPYGHHAAEVAPLQFIREKAKQGHTLTDIARMLNADAVPSRRGGKWYPMVVSRILAAGATA